MQVVTFRLKGMARADYDAMCELTAPAIAAVPGLVAKVWLADESTNTYGGVYTWLAQLPGLRALRAPARHLVVFQLAL